MPGSCSGVVSNCGANLPVGLFSELNDAADEDAALNIGIAHTVQQAQDLIDAGVPGMHFYVLNKSQTTGAILSQLRFDGP